MMIGIHLYQSLSRAALESLSDSFSVCSTSMRARVVWHVAALTGTGGIWAYYSLLVRPRSWGLFSANAALCVCNGWNALRKWRWDEAQLRAATASTTPGTR